MSAELHNKTMILGSSQGLFCLYGNHVGTQSYSGTETAAIWNPAIRKLVDIGQLPHVDENMNVTVGFGVCPHTLDPKIVTVSIPRVLTENTGTWQVEVFRLSLGAWTSLSINLPPGITLTDYYGPYEAADYLPDPNHLYVYKPNSRHFRKRIGNVSKIMETDRKRFGGVSVAFPFPGRSQTGTACLQAFRCFTADITLSDDKDIVNIVEYGAKNTDMGNVCASVLHQKALLRKLLRGALVAPIVGTKPDDMTDANYKLQEEKALSTILLCLSDEVLYEVGDEETAVGVCKKLETIYMTKSLTNKLLPKQRLFSLRMKEGSSLKEHLDALNSILDLKNVEVKIEDEDTALVLLVSLPPSFESFVISFVLLLFFIFDYLSIVYGVSVSYSLNVLYLMMTAFEELVKEMYWEFIRKKRNQIAFLYGDDDHSGPLCMHDEIVKQVPDAVVEIEKEGHSYFLLHRSWFSLGGSSRNNHDQQNHILIGFMREHHS
nr:retrovirus-related Pol polyprotein from transposon TNT 1-94 [Tanacetum cinerariifolium]